MTSAGILIAAIIIWLEIVIFACLTGLPAAGVFYLAKANLSGQFYPEKISEGE
jgi:energy-converting hydrogenase Eha subunit B